MVKTHGVYIIRDERSKMRHPLHSNILETDMPKIHGMYITGGKLRQTDSDHINYLSLLYAGGRFSLINSLGDMP